MPNDNTSGSSLLLYSHHTIYNLGLLSPEDQITLLLSQSPPGFDQAIAVACSHDLSPETIQHLHLQYGYYLFSQSTPDFCHSVAGLFDDAVPHFTESRCTPQQVLGLLPELKIPSISAM